MRHLRRIALYGTLLVAALFVVLLAVAVFMQATTPHLRADEARAAWFKGLKQPGNGISCCDVSDCRRADAEWRGGEKGQWWATVNGAWTPIPPGTELATRSIDGDAYVCASPAGHIYCFVRPDSLY